MRSRPTVAGTAVAPIGLALLILALPARAAPATEPASDEVLFLSNEMRVRVSSGRDLALEALPRHGEDWGDLARRLAGPDAVGAKLAKANGGGPLTPSRWVRVPFPDLPEDLAVVVLRNVFPKDRLEGTDWIHTARAAALPLYDEGLWQVALWFCGDGARFEDLRRANRLASPELKTGVSVRIPAALLRPGLRAVPASDDGRLVYGRDAAGDYAGYRLEPGEALWTSVVLRFTGRTAKSDVEALTRDLARRSGIHDPTDIPVGWLVKIPLDDLEPEFLPKDHPRRKRLDADRAAMDEEIAARPPQPTSASLQGVTVILDPGHGGLDPGTENHGLWESAYVFDVAARLKRRLEAGTGAKVVMTMENVATGGKPSDTDALSRGARTALKTTPSFVPGGDGESSVGVHLRWYLANAALRRAIRDGADPDRVVFLSLHADARHPGLRGAMVYVPGASFREGTFGFGSSTYTRFKEVREQPRVSFTRRERLRSEAISRRLAASVIKAFRKDDLPVQDFKPVRERVIRGRKEWLPAVLRGNAVPAKLLIEMVNMANSDDATLLGKAADRERLALALAAALESFYGRQGSAATGDRPAARAGAGRGSP